MDKKEKKKITTNRTVHTEAFFCQENKTLLSTIDYYLLREVSFYALISYQ